MENHSESECCVCYSKTDLETTPCNHITCKPCLKKLYEDRCHDHAICPICRNNIRDFLKKMFCSGIKSLERDHIAFEDGTIWGLVEIQQELEKTQNLMGRSLWYFGVMTVIRRRIIWKENTYEYIINIDQSLDDIIDQDQYQGVGSTFARSYLNLLEEYEEGEREMEQENEEMKISTTVNNDLTNHAITTESNISVPAAEQKTEDSKEEKAPHIPHQHPYNTRGQTQNNNNDNNISITNAANQDAITSLLQKIEQCITHPSEDNTVTNNNNININNEEENEDDPEDEDYDPEIEEEEDEDFYEAEIRRNNINTEAAREDEENQERSIYLDLPGLVDEMHESVAKHRYFDQFDLKLPKRKTLADYRTK